MVFSASFLLALLLTNVFVDYDLTEKLIENDDSSKKDAYDENDAENNPVITHIGPQKISFYQKIGAKTDLFLSAIFQKYYTIKTDSVKLFC